MKLHCIFVFTLLCALSQCVQSNTLKTVKAVAPINTAALIGQQVTLNCKRDSTNVAWTYLSRLTGSFGIIVVDCLPLAAVSDRYRTDNSDGACNLIIDTLTIELAGTYTCQDTTSSERATAAEVIAIESPPQCFTNASSEVVLDESVLFSCTIPFVGKLSPDMIWTDELGRELSKAFNIKENMYTETGIIRKAQLPEMKSSECKTYFIAPVIDPSPGVDHAVNAPSFTSTWISPTFSVTTGCPQSFQYSATPKLCYNVVVQRRSWNDANRYCVGLHPSARLVVINNVQEQDVFKAAINRLSQAELASCLDFYNTHFFTSGQRKQFNNCQSSFVWRPSPEIPETDVRDVSWATGQPDCAQSGFENCIDMWYEKQGNLNDNHCERLLCSICQIRV